MPWFNPLLLRVAYRAQLVGGVVMRVPIKVSSSVNVQLLLSHLSLSLSLSLCMCSLYTYRRMQVRINCACIIWGRGWLWVLSLLSFILS